MEMGRGTNLGKKRSSSTWVMLSMRFLLITLRESQIDSWFSKRDSSAYTKCLKLWAE